MKKYFSKAISVGLCLILGAAVLTGCEKSVTSSKEESNVSSAAYKPHPKDPKDLDPVLGEKLRIDYLNYLNRRSECYKLSEIYVQEYFGTYNGVDIVFIGAPISLPAVEGSSFEVAGYKFLLNTPQTLYAHVEQAFMTLEMAYKMDYLTKEEIYDIKMKVSPDS